MRLVSSVACTVHWAPECFALAPWQGSSHWSAVIAPLSTSSTDLQHASALAQTDGVLVLFTDDFDVGHLARVIGEARTATLAALVLITSRPDAFRALEEERRLCTPVVVLHVRTGPRIIVETIRAFLECRRVQRA